MRAAATNTSPLARALCTFTGSYVHDATSATILPRTRLHDHMKYKHCAPHRTREAKGRRQHIRVHDRPATAAGTFCTQMATSNQKLLACCQAVLQVVSLFPSPLIIKKCGCARAARKETPQNLHIILPGGPSTERRRLSFLTGPMILIVFQFSGASPVGRVYSVSGLADAVKA